jgi:hypothetical protein
MRLSAITLFAVLAGTCALAQTEVHDKAIALIGPMMQEVAPGRGGEVFTACVVSLATPEELAAFAAAPGPSQEVGAMVTTVLARPETMACAQTALQ